MVTHTLSTALRLVDEKVRMVAAVPGKPEITTDYFPPIGTGEGYTPLELTLISFSACLSTTLLTILRYSMKKTVKALSARAEGTQREESPKILAGILVAIEIDADDLTDEEVGAALARAEQICPVWNMIDKRVSIDVRYQIG